MRQPTKANPARGWHHGGTQETVQACGSNAPDDITAIGHLQASTLVRKLEDETLLDALAMALDHQSIEVVNVLCALGLTFETATLIVSAGNDAMLSTYDAIREACERNARRTATLLVKRGLADDR